MNIQKRSKIPCKSEIDAELAEYSSDTEIDLQHVQLPALHNESSRALKFHEALESEERMFTLVHILFTACSALVGFDTEGHLLIFPDGFAVILKKNYTPLNPENNKTARDEIIFWLLLPKPIQSTITYLRKFTMNWEKLRKLFPISYTM